MQGRKGKTDLYDGRGGCVHDDPGCALRTGPSVLVYEGGVSRVGGVVCGRHLDGEVAEHVGPVLALLYGGGKYDIDGCGDGDEEGGDACDLEDIVCACKRPMILSGEDEVEEENDGECESDTCEKDLNGERLSKRRTEFEDGVLRIRIVLSHDLAKEK